MNTVLLQDRVNASGVQFGTSGARGLVSHMSADVCYVYAAAFLDTVAADAEVLVLGHDLRPSSPAIAQACAQAATDAGLDIIFVGALPTPAVAYFASMIGAPAIVVTGSHIPFDRNGIKFYRADGEISKEDERAMLASSVFLPPDVQLAPLPEVNLAAREAYIARYASFCEANALRALRVGVYEHSSVARDIVRSILEQLGAEVISLGRTDTFVPIDTEAVAAEDVARAHHWAAQHRFDAILSTDGDGDRPLIGDENGNWLRGDLVGMLCARYLNSAVVVTPVSSNTAVEKSGWFAQVVRTRIGSPYVIAGIEAAKSGMDTVSVISGYEANGGFLLGCDAGRNGKILTALPTRDAILPILAVLCMAAEAGQPISAIAADLPQRYTASDRVQNIPMVASQALLKTLVDDSEMTVALLAPDSGPVVETNTVDGLRVTFGNGDIVHLRPSGNAPELRCYAEADSEERARLLCHACLERVRQYSFIP